MSKGKLEQPFYLALCHHAARETRRLCPSIPAARLRGVVMPQARRWRLISPTRLGRRGSAHQAHAADPAGPRPNRTAWGGFDRRSVRDALERARRLRSRTRHATHSRRRAPARRSPRRDDSASGSRGQARAPGAPRRAAARPPRSPAAAPPPTHFRRLKLRPPPLTVRARTSSTHPAGTPPTDPLRAL